MATKPFVLPSGVDFYAGDGTAAGAADPLLVVSDSTNKVGINSQTPSGTLDINTASASDKGLILRGSTSQSANLLELQNSSNSGLFSIDQLGSVYFAPWSGTTLSSVKYNAPSNNIIFTGSGASASGINLNILPDSTLSFESTAGQLFSISDGLASGTIFSVNDISGMSSLEIDASGLIKIGEYDGFLGIGTSQSYSQYTGKVEINAPSGYKGLIARGSSFQSSSLVEVQNSNSGILAYVGPSGVIGGSGININPYSTSASGLPTFRVAFGNNLWSDQYGSVYRPTMSTYGTIAAQGMMTRNDGSTLAASGITYTTGSLSGTYYYRICAIGPNGEENPYTAAPTTATPINSGVTLLWDLPTSNYIPISKFRIYRTSSNQPYVAGTAGNANPFTYMGGTNPAYNATTQGTSVYFDTVDGTAVSFTDSGAAGTAGFPPDHYRGPEGWLVSNRGLKVPGLFTCMAQGSYTIGPAVNVNGVLFTNSSIVGGNSNNKTIQAYSLDLQITNGPSYFQVSNTTNGANFIQIAPTSGATYMSMYDGSALKVRLAPYITNTGTDSTAASGISYYFATTQALTDPRKLMSVQNGTTERFAISAYGTTTTTLGNATAKGIIVTSAASQSANLFEVQNSAGTALLAITPSGSISGAISPTLLTSTGNLTLTDVHHGYIIEQTGVSASGTFTLGTITIPTWNCSIVNIGSGVIVASGSNTMRSPGGLNKSRTQYSSISIYRRGDGSFILGGDLA